MVVRVKRQDRARGGIKYTIKDGIVYDARQLLADVERMVARQKAERGITRLSEID